MRSKVAAQANLRLVSNQIEDSRNFLIEQLSNKSILLFPLCVPLPIFCVYVNQEIVSRYFLPYSSNHLRQYIVWFNANIPQYQMYVISDSYRDDNSDLHHSSFSFRLKCFIFLKKYNSHQIVKLIYCEELLSIFLLLMIQIMTNIKCSKKTVLR